jgi:glycosyltransferase involved in cell wall biosynthesis
MIDRLADRGHRAVDGGRGAISKLAAPHASVCIPTLNGGDLLGQIVERLAAQRCPWEFEIIILDSESEDGSTAALPDLPKLRVETIRRRDFQHGRSRNQLAGMARGAFIAFLTQDAYPADVFWLYNLVTTLEHFPNAAGAFGRHIPWPDASPFTRREIETHFADFERYPLAMSRDTDSDRWHSGDPAWRQVLHFFSDNASCLRKSVWERLPFPEVEYGEDQLWCDRILKAGLQRVYAPGAVVLHSHNYSPEDYEKRIETEIRFFQEQFGHVLFDLNTPPEDRLRERNNEDEWWARANGVGQSELDQRYRLNEAWMRGALRGAVNAPSAVPVKAKRERDRHREAQH